MKKILAGLIILTFFLSTVGIWLFYYNDMSGLVKTSGSDFFIDNKKFTFVGANSFELWQYEVPQINRLLDMAFEHNIRVIRVILGGTAFENPMGTYNEFNLKKLDYVLAYCRLKGIYVIVTLKDSYWSADVYWFRSNGSADFSLIYRDPEVANAYKNYANMILNRVNVYNYKTYKLDPVIMAWDLWNEPDVAISPNETAKIFSFLNEMSEYVKSIDSAHLVTVGLCHESNVKYVLSFVNFVSIHSYPDNQGNVADFGLLPADRPEILEEFGVNRTYLGQDKEAAIYRAYLDESNEKNLSGAMFWNLGLGHNPWDRWEDQDRRLFDVLGSGPLLFDTPSASILDRVFFTIGFVVQFLSSNSGYATIILLVSAVIVGVGIILLRRLNKIVEVPKEFDE